MNFDSLSRKKYGEIGREGFYWGLVTAILFQAWLVYFQPTWLPDSLPIYVPEFSTGMNNGIGELIDIWLIAILLPVFVHQAPFVILLMTLLTIPVINWKYRKFYTDHQERENHLRGALRWSAKQLQKAVKKDHGKKGARIMLGDAPIPRKHENQGFLLIGNPGSGKSVLLFNLADQIAKSAEGDKVVVLDRKPEFVQKFKRPDDYIFYPRAVGSIQWDLGQEIRCRDDIRFFVDVAIPVVEGDKQPVFNKASRLILEAILLHLFEKSKMAPEDIQSLHEELEKEAKNQNLHSSSEISDEQQKKIFANWMEITKEGLTNKTFMDFVSAHSPESLLEELQPTMERYRINLDFFLQGGSSFVGSVLGNFFAMMNESFLVEDFYYNGTWSIKDYLAEPGDKRLFVVNRAKEDEIFNAWYRAFLGFLSREIRSLDNDTERRIWLLLDEIQTLENLENSVIKLIEEARQKGACVVAATQLFTSLLNIYDKSADKFKMLGMHIYLRNSNPEDQKEIVAIAGEAEVQQYDPNSSFRKYSGQSENEQLQMNSQRKDRKTIMESELGTLSVKPVKGGVKFAGFIKTGHYPITDFSYRTIDLPEIYQIEEQVPPAMFTPLPRKKNDQENNEKPQKKELSDEERKNRMKEVKREKNKKMEAKLKPLLDDETEYNMPW